MIKTEEQHIFCKACGCYYVSLVSLLYKYYIHLAQNVIIATATTANFCTNGSLYYFYVFEDHESFIIKPTLVKRLYQLRTLYYDSNIKLATNDRYGRGGGGSGKKLAEILTSLST
jgi:hypothetical protein